jgi:hypothetical protein
MNKLKNSFAVALVAIGALWAGTANAGDVRWSVGVNLPVPVVVGAPVYYEPAPVYAPPPVYYRPAPRVVYAPRYYQPSYGRYYGPREVRWDRHDHRGWDRDHGRNDRWHDHDDRRGGRDDRDHGPRGGRH